MSQENDDRKKSTWGRYFEYRKSYTRATIIPYLFIAYPLAGLLIGGWIDDRFNTSPWFLLVFLVAGFVEAVREMMSIAKSIEREMEEEERQKKEEKEKRKNG